jgi:hypothetical protein
MVGYHSFQDRVIFLCPFIHLWATRLILVLVSSTAMNMNMQVCLWYVDISIGFALRSGIDGTGGRPIFTFLRNHHTIFHNGCTNYIPIIRVPFSPQKYLLFLSFYTSHSKWDKIINVFTYISMRANRVEHFFINLLDIWIFSLEKCIPILCQVLIGTFCYWVFKVLTHSGY